MIKNKTAAHGTASHFLFAVVAVFALCLGAMSQMATVLHNFSGTTSDGANPQQSGLLSLGGKFYGDTVFGGAHGNGAVYAMSPQTNGTWRVSVLYSFTGGNDGESPLGSLVADSLGNLYGVTPLGGAQSGGTAYKLSKTSIGSWQLRVLWSFGAAGDAAYPFAGLAIDKSGNLFGTTTQGGPYGQGTVFELSPSSGGAWTEQVLYSFGASASDGMNPYAPVIMDTAGNLYGTTAGGGSNSCDQFTLGCGTVFKLSPGTGGWTETIIHFFENNGTDGFYTLAPLVIDPHGNLYGATQFGGGSSQCQSGGLTEGCGVVFKLSPSSGGAWPEHILYAFTGGTGPSQPNSALTFDTAGNIYGETALTSTSDGSVYRLSRSTSGQWGLTTLVNFTGTNGSNPQGGLIFGGGGHLFGAAISGGTSGLGVVFQVTP
jgi:uncharacterized repeat protein (TIGR03803 family)